MTSFRLRNVLCEQSLSKANELNRPVGGVGFTFPTFHIFGITNEGKKACVHVHGVLPYIVLRVGGDLTPRVEDLMRAKINRLVHRETKQNKERRDDERPPNCVHHIEAVTARSLYGYHESMEQFARIYFSNPFHANRAFVSLGREAEGNSALQPYEAHLPFTLQFFVDHSLFGMDEVIFRKVLFRMRPGRPPTDDLFEGTTVGSVRSDSLSPLAPVTSCWVECDAQASDIMNAQLQTNNVHSSNPGLEYIWREEEARCKLQNRPLEDTFNHYAARPYTTNRGERELLTRMRQTARLMRQRGDAVADTTQLTQNFNDTVMPGPLDETIVHSPEAESVWSQMENPLTQQQKEEYVNSEKTSKKKPKALVDEESDEESDLDEFDMSVMVDEAGTDQTEEVEQDDEDSVSPALLNRPRSAPSHDETIEDSRWYTLPEDLPLRQRVDLHSASHQTHSQTSTFHSQPRAETSVYNKLLFADSPFNRTIMAHSTSQEQAVPTDGEVSEVSHLTVASVEVLAHTIDSMPDPTVCPVMAVSICILADVCRNPVPAEHVFITTLPKELLPRDSKTLRVDDEKDIFAEVVRIVQRWDPDMLFGYDTDRLSWGYLCRRSDVIGLPQFHASLSRYYNDTTAWHRTDGTVSAPSGRLMEAVWKIVRRDLKLRSYDRCAAVLSVLKRRIAELDDRALSKMVEYMDRREMEAVVIHLQRLSLVNVQLLSEMDWFLRNAEMARVYGIQFHEVYSRGTQLRVESMLFRLAHRQGYLAPSVTPAQRSRMCAPEQLQLILEPQSKVYFDPVIVLDFQSLYPSMVIAYNYCFSSLLGKVAHLRIATDLGESEIDMGAVKYPVDYASVVRMVAARQVHVSPLSAAYVTKGARDAVVPTMLREVLGARIMIKTAMKHTKSKRLLRILDARQLALKLVANVTYGYTAANCSGRMPCVEVADAILGKGRETLERAIERVNSGDYEGARVIYGDTDSMFILMKGCTLEKAFAVGRRIAADVTADNPAPVVLKLEKVYTGCVLETKKRYAGWMFESEKDEGRLDAKGIETVRRDTCPLVAKILERSLELILQHKLSTFNLYIDSRLSSLDEVPYTDFVFCKEYRGDYAENAPVPQRKIAAWLQSACPAHMPIHGERLPYVVVESHPDATVISCVRPLAQFVRDTDLKINLPYYVRAHVIAALRRVTDLLPLRIEWNHDKARHCFEPGCMTVGRRPWCVPCSMHPSALRLAALAVARNERLRSTARTACVDCLRQSRPDMAACTNQHCVVKQVWNGIARNGAELALEEHALADS